MYVSMYVRNRGKYTLFIQVGILITACNRENHPKFFRVGATTIRYARVHACNMKKGTKDREKKILTRFSHQKEAGFAYYLCIFH